MGVGVEWEAPDVEGGGLGAEADFGFVADGLEEVFFPFVGGAEVVAFGFYENLDVIIVGGGHYSGEWFAG